MQVTAPATNTETAIVIDILRKNAERLRIENKAHRQVAINIQDTLTKATAEVAELKGLMLNASKHIWLVYPALAEELEEAAK